MSAAENKQRMQAVFAELARNNAHPFVDSMADDIVWTIIGTTSWSQTCRGKAEFLTKLLGPLTSMLESGFTITAHRFIAEDDHVVVEARGRGTTKSGKPYDNTYCFVFRMAGGKLKEVTEYMDTALLVSALS
jgi:ketosteroid isomerase-like protein